MKKILILAFFLLSFSRVSHAQIADCNMWTIQNAVNAAAEGATINIPAGVCQTAATVQCSTSSTNAANSCSGVVIAGKGVRLVGAGNSRIIAWTAMASAVTIGTGSKTFTGVLGTKVSCPSGPPCAGTALNYVTPTITVGQTLTVMENMFAFGVIANTMTGTVTCWNASSGACTAGQLILNVTSTTGTTGTTTTAALAVGATSIPVVSSAGFTVGAQIRIATPSDFGPSGGPLLNITAIPDGTHLTTSVTGSAHASGVLVTFGVKNQVVSNSKRWIIWNGPSVSPRTAISTCVPNTVTVPMFQISEDTGFNTTISNLDIMPCNSSVAGSAENQRVLMEYTTNGKPIILHDLFMGYDATYSQNHNGDSTMIEGNSTRGLIYNVSAVMSPFQNAGPAFENIKDTGGVTNSWTTASTWGATDATETAQRYVESSDFHGLGTSTDVDDNARQVARYNLYNDSMISTHGADTSSWGQRYFEVYDSIFTFQGYGDGTTPNVSNGAWIFLRGGTFIAHDNVMPAISSGDYGTGKDAQLIAMNLQRNQGPNPCWATGFGATNANGFAYPLPRQCGFGSKSANLTTARTPVTVVMFKNASGANCDFRDNCDTGGLFKQSGGAPAAPFALDFSISGYASAPASTVLDATGSGATCVSTLSGSQVGSFTCSGGSGYTGANFDSTTYIGDNEPIFMWGNVRAVGGTVVTNSITVSDYCASSGQCSAGGNNCSGVTVDFSANYIKSGRDYFALTTQPTSPPLTGLGYIVTYTPAAYPNPLTNILSVNPSAENFGSIVVGSSSATQTATLTNGTGASITITSTNTTGSNPSDFPNTANTCSGTIAANGGTCSITTKFTPISTGARSATLTISTSAGNFPVALSGTGTSPTSPGVSFSPASINFGFLAVGTTSSPQTVTVTSTGTANLTFGPTGTSSPAGASFSTSGGTCPISGTLTPTSSCTVILQAQANSGAGVMNGTFNFPSNVAGSPQTVPLTVTLTSSVEVAPTLLNLGQVAQGQTSAGGVITLTNGSGVSITISSLTVTPGLGIAQSDFSIFSTTCSGVIVNNGTCTATITFRPSATTGTNELAALSIAFTGAGGSPVMATLSGTVLPPIGTPATNIFASNLAGCGVAKLTTFCFTTTGKIYVAVCNPTCGAFGPLTMSVSGSAQ